MAPVAVDSLFSPTRNVTMDVRVTFSKDGETLLDVTYPVQADEDGESMLEPAFRVFRRRFPRISLFDGINVRFDKAD
jgi:hypothetical protein